MPDDCTSTEYRTALDDRLASALESAEADRLRPAAAVVGESDNRWHGRLVARSYEAASGEPESTTDAVLRGATAVELLQGYCQLRNGLLVQLADEVAHSLNWDPAAAVLSGDFLQTTAYSAVLSAETDRRDDCLERLIAAMDDIVSAVSATDAGPPRSAAEYESFTAETVGRLGAVATGIGAILGGADESRRERFESFGRDVSTARRLRRRLDSETRGVHVAPPVLDEAELRRFAACRLQRAERTLDGLSTGAESPLAGLVAACEETDS